MFVPLLNASYAEDDSLPTIKVVLAVGSALSLIAALFFW